MATMGSQEDPPLPPPAYSNACSWQLSYAHWDNFYNSLTPSKKNSSLIYTFSLPIIPLNKFNYKNIILLMPDPFSLLTVDGGSVCSQRRWWWVGHESCDLCLHMICYGFDGFFVVLLCGVSLWFPWWCWCLLWWCSWWFLVLMLVVAGVGFWWWCSPWLVFGED